MSTKKPVSTKKAAKDAKPRGGGKGGGRGDRGAEDAGRPATGPTPIAGAEPSGQRLYDMPYSAPEPRLISPELGLHNLVTRAGHNAGYSIDVTLLDAPDHRLIRSGVLLAHRVLEGRGEWYLAAPGWQPVLPEEQVEPMGQADLPEQLTDLVRPFRRRATLGPVAALSCERREFALRDDRGTTMALLRDDKVTVRRNGLTTARYREVMLTPTGPGLSEEQSAHVARVLGGAGATEVPRFPRLVSRLGAPATGPTDFPDRQPLEQDATFSRFVSQLLSNRLRDLLDADLAVRAGDGGAGTGLGAATARLRTELEGLRGAVDASWLEDLDEELQWLRDEATQERAPDGGDAAPALAARLRGERYLTLLERLVTATRAPQVGDAGARPAPEVLAALVDAAQDGLLRLAGRLSADSPAEDWQATRTALEELHRTTVVALHLLPERVEKLRHRLGVATQLLAEAARHDDEARRHLELAARSSPEEAFRLGRVYEREQSVAAGAREAFVRRWAKTSRKLG